MYDVMSALSQVAKFAPRMAVVQGRRWRDFIGKAMIQRGEVVATMDSFKRVRARLPAS